MTCAFWLGFEKRAAEGRVFVYRNIRKGPKSYVYSVRKSDGKVGEHVTDLVLVSPKFKVSDAGNRRVRREGVKNVHAGIEGSVGKVDQSKYTWSPITYNPKKSKEFVDRETGTPVTGADVVRFTSSGVLAGFRKAASGHTGAGKGALGTDPERPQISSTEEGVGRAGGEDTRTSKELLDRDRGPRDYSIHHNGPELQSGPIVY